MEVGIFRVHFQLLWLILELGPIRYGLREWSIVQLWLSGAPLLRPHGWQWISVQIGQFPVLGRWVCAEQTMRPSPCHTQTPFFFFPLSLIHLKIPYLR